MSRASASIVRSRRVATKRKRKPDDEQPDETQLDVVLLSDVVPTEARYLVEPYVPRGTITVLEGDPSAGKSYVAADLGAALTRGRVPDLGLGHKLLVGSPRSVVYLTTEDSPGTLRERFAAQGADLTRVAVIPRMVSARNLAPLEHLLAKRKPALLVIDPIHALLDQTNMNAANSVRVALAPLAALAARMDLAILAVRHLAKAGRGRAIYRGIGSIDFSAIARSVLRIGEDPERPGSRLLVQVKNSLGPLGCPLEFEIGERLVWLGRSELSAQDLDSRPKTGRGRSAVEIAEAFLQEQLATGAKSATELETAAVAAGITARTLERAQANLGVRHLRVNEGGGRRGQGRWVWSLPATAHAGDLEPSS